MKKVMIIGAGGVGAVVAHKCASLPEVFEDILLASRTKEKCDRIAAAIGKPHLYTAQIDADDVDFDEDTKCPECGKDLFPELPEGAEEEPDAELTEDDDE